MILDWAEVLHKDDFALASRSNCYCGVQWRRNLCRIECLPHLLTMCSGPKDGSCAGFEAFSLSFFFFFFGSLSLLSL
jgi:hypothetical protein